MSVPVVFGKRGPVPNKEENFYEWNTYIVRLCDALLKTSDCYHVVNVGGQTVFKYEHKLASILQAEIQLRTGQILNISLLSALERSSVGFQNHQAFAMVLHWLEHYLKNGHLNINISA
jgi:hypothetical protein